MEERADFSGNPTFWNGSLAFQDIAHQDVGFCVDGWSVGSMKMWSSLLRSHWSSRQHSRSAPPVAQNHAECSCDSQPPVCVREHSDARRTKPHCLWQLGSTRNEHPKSYPHPVILKGLGCISLPALSHLGQASEACGLYHFCFSWGFILLAWYSAFSWFPSLP